MIFCSAGGCLVVRQPDADRSCNPPCSQPHSYCSEVGVTSLGRTSQLHYLSSHHLLKVHSPTPRKSMSWGLKALFLDLSFYPMNILNVFTVSTVKIICIQYKKCVFMQLRQKLHIVNTPNSTSLKPSLQVRSIMLSKIPFFVQ